MDAAQRLHDARAERTGLAALALLAALAAGRSPDAARTVSAQAPRLKPGLDVEESLAHNEIIVDGRR